MWVIVAVVAGLLTVSGVITVGTFMDVWGISFAHVLTGAVFVALFGPIFGRIAAALYSATE
jgi:hypothetical protein